MNSITLTLPDTLYHQLESIARNEGIPLNEYLLYALTRWASSAFTVKVVSEAEREKQRKEFDALLRNLNQASDEDNGRRPGRRRSKSNGEVEAKPKRKTKTAAPVRASGD